MKLYYVANARIPTEKAHGLTIVKSCAAFARAGAKVILVIPMRHSQFTGDLFETYQVPPTFQVRVLPVFDFIARSPSVAAFWATSIQFYLQVFWLFLWMGKHNVIVYARDPLTQLLSLLGVRTVLESHHVFHKQRLYFWCARHARKIITISHALKDKFVTAGFAAENIAVYPSGVDLGVFTQLISRAQARIELGLPTTGPVVAYTGNFTTMGKDKGISDILKALVELPQVQFVAAGGSDQDRARYVIQARELGVVSRVTLVGYGPQKNLALYQRAADILLMPFPDIPHYRSNMSPVKMFEYMASERPVIASDLPTIREVLNEKNSVIVPPDSPHDLARAIHNLLDNPDRGSELAAVARRDVEAFSWDARARGVLDFVNKN